MSRRWTAKTPTSGYLVAIAATLIVLLLRLLLSSLVGDSAYFSPFVIAVTLSAWYGGLRPGLLSTLLGSVFAVFFFVPPYYTLRITDARIGTGLVFFVMAETATTSNIGAALPTAETTLRILVVDDNQDSAETLSILLQMLGYNVSVAYDGEEALQKAIDLRPGVVLLDIGLPKLNGYEVARRIRLEPWGNAPMLVAITGWGQAEDKDLSREAGFDHHLVKPVEPDTLLSLIQKRKSTAS